MKLETKLKIALSSNSEEEIHFVFEQIYNEYYKLIFFIVQKDIKDIEDIYDIVQETFIEYFNHITNNIENIKYYLLTIAKNKVLAYKRIKGRIDIIEYKDSIIDLKYNEKDNLSYDEIIYILKKYLQNDEVELILLKNIDNMKFKDIAKKQNLSINTVISTYNRAIKKIKERNVL